MLESGDFTNIMFQDTPRYKKPVGIYWLQAASVAALSDAGGARDLGLPHSLGAGRDAGGGGLRLGRAGVPRAPCGDRRPARCWRPPRCSPPNRRSPPPTRRSAGRSRSRWRRWRGSTWPTRGGPPAHRWTWLLFWLGMARRGAAEGADRTDGGGPHRPGAGRLGPARRLAALIALGLGADRLLRRSCCPGRWRSRWRPTAASGAWRWAATWRRSCSAARRATARRPATSCC